MLNQWKVYDNTQLEFGKQKFQYEQKVLREKM